MVETDLTDQMLTILPTEVMVETRVGPETQPQSLAQQSMPEKGVPKRLRTVTLRNKEAPGGSLKEQECQARVVVAATEVRQ